MKIKFTYREEKQLDYLHEIFFTIHNLTGKTIKYYTPTFLYYNRVDDVVGPEQGIAYKFTGPVGPDREEEDMIDDIDHDACGSVRSELVDIEIEYMDKSKEVLTPDQIDLKFIPQGNCYIATAVYGSYQTPELWVLRRYRDCYLSARWWGRCFIGIYYFISPILVKCLTPIPGVKKQLKRVLNCFVERLRRNGYSDTPYQDK